MQNCPPVRKTQNKLRYFTVANVRETMVKTCNKFCLPFEQLSWICVLICIYVQERDQNIVYFDAKLVTNMLIFLGETKDIAEVC